MVFTWARAAKPEQPLTSGVWKGDYSADEKLTSTEKIQLAESDVITFHIYDSGEEFEKTIKLLQRYNPDRLHILCDQSLVKAHPGANHSSGLLSCPHEAIADGFPFDFRPRRFWSKVRRILNYRRRQEILLKAEAICLRVSAPASTATRSAKKPACCNTNSLFINAKA